MYIQCDSCSDWYHTACVGLTPEQAQALENWSCDPCIKKKDSKDKKNKVRHLIFRIHFYSKEIIMLTLPKWKRKERSMKK